MIIVSQDKEEIFILENIISINIEKNGFGGSYFIVATTNTYQTHLGKYNSLERAKEILQDIIENYKSKLVIKFKDRMNLDDERARTNYYNRFFRNKQVVLSDERKDIKYIPSKNNVYYMPEEWEETEWKE